MNIWQNYAKYLPILFMNSLYGLGDTTCLAIRTPSGKLYWMIDPDCFPTSKKLELQVMHVISSSEYDLAPSSKTCPFFSTTLMSLSESMSKALNFWLLTAKFKIFICMGKSCIKACSFSWTKTIITCIYPMCQNIKLQIILLLLCITEIAPL